MAFLRLTMIQPRPGSETEANDLLQELDTSLGQESGLLFSLIVNPRSERIGRLSLWRTKDDANRVATTDHIMSVRSRLHYISLSTDETMLEVQSGHFSEAVNSLLGDFKMPASLATVA